MDPLNLSNFKLSSSPTPAAPTMPTGSSAAPLDLSKYKLGYSMQSQTPSTLPTIGQKVGQALSMGQEFTVQPGGDIPGMDKIIQGLGTSLTQSVSSPLFKWSPLGWAGDIVGGITNFVADQIKKGTDPMAVAVGTGLRNLVGPAMADKIGASVANNKTIQGLAKVYSSPSVAGNLNAVNQIASAYGQIAMSVSAGEAVPEAVDAVTKPGTPIGDILSSKAVKSETTNWERPTKTTSAGFSKARDIFSNANTKISETLVKNGTHLADNVTEGKYSTSDTADQYRADAGKASRDLLRPSLKIADYSTPKTPVSTIAIPDDIIQAQGRGVTPDDMDTIRNTIENKKLSSLNAKYPNGMGLADMLNEAITYDQNGKYSPVGDNSVDNNAIANRSVASVLRNLIKANAPEGVPVQEFWDELHKQYQAADYLDALNGKKVPQSVLSKIANYGGKLAGAAIGQQLGGGILSDVAGYHVGGMVESMIENLPNPLKGHFLNMLEISNPDAFDELSKYMSKEQLDMLQRNLLPSPSYTPMGSRTPSSQLVNPEYEPPNLDQEKINSRLTSQPTPGKSTAAETYQKPFSNISSLSEVNIGYKGTAISSDDLKNLISQLNDSGYSDENTGKFVKSTGGAKTEIYLGSDNQSQGNYNLLLNPKTMEVRISPTPISDQQYVGSVSDFIKNLTD